MLDADVEIYKAIRKAIKDGDLKQVEAMIGEDPSRIGMMTPFGTWLHVAAAHGQIEIARWLISKGLDIDAEGVTVEGAPIHFAASEGHLDTVRFLFDSGAKLDISEPNLNPLFGAIYGDHVSVAKFLIDNGIDTGVSYTGDNMKNMDAMSFAREWGRSEIVDLLKTSRSGTRRA